MGTSCRKPPITFAHNEVAWMIGVALGDQLGLEAFVIRVDAGLVRRSESTYYIPDVMVIPRSEARRLFPDPNTWEVYPEPLPLVIEIWSTSTGRYDVTEKLGEYQRRGDQEIWFIHPVEHTLTAWRRQPDGAYTEQIYRGGSVVPASLPDFRIDLDEIFRRLD